MRHRTVVGIAMILAACTSPTGPDDTCTGSVAEYCTTVGGICPSFDEAVARARALCSQPGIQLAEVATCEGVFRSVRWRYIILGGGDQYFDASDRLTAAYLTTDHNGYCGNSFTQTFGTIPTCPAPVVTASLCPR